jgi:hypothetical protein
MAQKAEGKTSSYSTLLKASSWPQRSEAWQWTEGLPRAYGACHLEIPISVANQQGRLEVTLCEGYPMNCWNGLEWVRLPK